MKKCLGLFLFVLMMAFAVNAQTIKTAEGKQLDKIEKQISQIDTQIDRLEKESADLASKYSSDYYKIKQIEEKINALNEILLPLNVKKAELLKKRLTEILPNNQIELLKKIIIQNDQIIELLEKLVLKKTDF